MKEKFTRYICRYKILLFMFTMTALTGCGKDAYTDFFEGMESEENVENLEHVENSEVYITDKKVDITHDEDEAPEPEDVNESENLDEDVDAKSEADNEAESDPAEVYECFLSGKLSVEREEKQVTISNLFWDNDIKYCFLDIDGDGIDELHIKDNMIYYAIKAVDGAPQILFKGWWYYEPVVTDELCGILKYFILGYGSEDIELFPEKTFRYDMGVGEGL